MGQQKGSWAQLPRKLKLIANQMEEASAGGGEGSPSRGPRKGVFRRRQRGRHWWSQSRGSGKGDSPSFSAMSRPLVNDSPADLLGRGRTCGEVNGGRAGPSQSSPVPHSQAPIQVGGRDWVLARTSRGHRRRSG